MNEDNSDVERAELDIFVEEVADEVVEAAGVNFKERPGLPCTGPPFLAVTFGSTHC